MNAAKIKILLLWLLIVASLGNASAATPGATENRVWQKSSDSLETRQAEPTQTAGRHQENGGVAYDDALDSLLAAKTGVPRITEKGIARIEQHLGRPELNALSDPGNAAMIQRLRAGSTSPQDINFYMHELKESAIMNRGVGARDAHLQTLQWQGIPYKAGYESQLYHPSVIQQFPEYFNPAAHP